MILLEFHNRIIEETLRSAIEAAEKPNLDVQLVDFDGVTFHISNPAGKDERNVVTVSIAWPVIPTLMANGSQAELQRLYGAYATAPEANHHYSLTLDLNALSAADQQTIPRHISLMKRHVLAGPFLKAFAEANSGGGSQSMVQYQYRPEEILFIKPTADSVTVIFSISFRDRDDQLFAKVFLQEFAAVKRNVRSAPEVKFSQKEPPLELNGIREVQNRPDLNFVTLVLFKNHIEPRNAHATIDMIQTFRNYLHYHLKCSKAYMHECMRNRVTLLLQVLNRAKPEPLDPRVKKIWGGKTFHGAGASKSLSGGTGRSKPAPRGITGRGGSPAAGRGAPAGRGGPPPVRARGGFARGH